MGVEGGLAAVIVAAGTSSRMGFDKLMHKLDGVEVLRRTAMAFDTHPGVDALVVTAGENLPDVQALFARHPTVKPLSIVPGAPVRAASAKAGVLACGHVRYVAIHDGARPFVSQSLISRVLAAAQAHGAAAPALPVTDTVKLTQDGSVAETLPRARLAAVQTPQIFCRAAYLRALESIPQQDYGALTDDCMVMERAGMEVALVSGEEANRKITTPADLPGTLRVGHGYDVHRLVPQRALVLGGVSVPHATGLLGHSDADVLLHAVMDALLGAAALGDIGRHFPDSDPACEGASSLALLGKVAALLRENGWRVQNLDATLVCQAPKLAPHIPHMRRNIAAALALPEDAVSVKATTEEGLGFSGRQEGIAAHCVALLVSGL